MRFVFAAVLFFSGAIAQAASDRQPAPASALNDAPPQFTRFTSPELSRGFMALAFGSDLRIGKKSRHVRRFDRPIQVHVASSGSVDRTAVMKQVVEEYAQKVPALRVTLTDDARAADITIRLIDEKDFSAALEAAYGRKVARAFVRKTDPQCMTGLQADDAGLAKSATSFVIVDRGETVFRDCAYHELLHALGLSNHDQANRFTTLNQNRQVGYLTAYDQALLTLLYDPRMRPGLSEAKARKLLPSLIEGLSAVRGLRRGG